MISQHNLQILCAALLAQRATTWWRALGQTEQGVLCLQRLLPIAHQSLGNSKLGTTDPWLCSNSACAGTLHHTAEESLCQRKCIMVQSAGSLFSLLQLRCLKNIPVFVHWNAGNKAGNLGEHHMENNDRLNVIFIAATLAWLEKVVTVLEEFSVLSQFSTTGDIHPKPTLSLLPNILDLLFSFPTAVCELSAFWHAADDF